MSEPAPNPASTPTPQAPTPQPTRPQMTPSEPMVPQRKKLPLLALVGLVLLALLGGAGYWVYTNVIHDTTMEATPKTAGSGSDPITSTKAYADPKKIYKLQMPANWTPKTSSADSMIMGLTPTESVTMSGGDNITAKTSPSDFVLVQTFATGDPTGEFKKTNPGMIGLQSHQLADSTGSYFQVINGDYTDVYYFLVKGSTTVAFKVRSHQAANTDSKYPDGYSRPELESQLKIMVASLRFTS